MGYFKLFHHIDDEIQVIFSDSLSQGEGPGTLIGRGLPWRLRGYQWQVSSQFTPVGNGIFEGMKSYPVKLPGWNHGSLLILDPYCWWTKSCTTKDDDYPIIYRVLTIPGGCLGFRPSTVLTNQLEEPEVFSGPLNTAFLWLWLRLESRSQRFTLLSF